MKKLAVVVLLLLSCASGIAAASGADIRLAPAPVNRLDEESLQRGARNFVNYCLTCHTAKYMRYNRLTDLGLTMQMPAVSWTLLRLSCEPQPGYAP